MSRIPIPTHYHSQQQSSPTRAQASSHIPPALLAFPSSTSDSQLRSISPFRRQNTATTSNSITSQSTNNNMSTVSGYQSSISLSETRKKQSKRDEAIRKKIESELSRKRTISTHQPSSGQQQRRKGGINKSAVKGTVAALKPTPALTVPETITVSEASQLCAAKRTDCVLVVDDDEGLSGIFTAKDLAYRVTAEGLDPHTTPVSQIMTRSPMVTRDTTSATEALQLMVSKHFRHLPVCNEDGNVVGLLDITKVFHEALSKVERSSAASEQLFSAMAGVQSELGGVSSNPQAAAMLAWAEKLRQKTALPDLTTVMDGRTQPATVGPKTTVKEVAKLMKERRTTAVCVMENVPGVNGIGMGGVGTPGGTRIAGIFTSKDVVLRVIAAGLDAERCSVVRVMTPHPDTAAPTMSVHDALKKMHNGHYLNLPVVEEDGRLVAIVDVLKLTYATLEQMNAMSGGDTFSTDNTEGGPMWGRFFDSIGHDDNESVFSGSHPGASSSAFPSLSSPNAPHNLSNFHLQQSPHSEVHPNDSASVIDDENDAGSVLDGYAKKKGLRVPIGAGSGGGVPVVDDGTYVFKFRTPSGRTHRFQARSDDVEHLREVVSGKLATDPFFTESSGAGGAEGGENKDRPDPNDFHLSYTDEDGDSVLITSDRDVADAVKIARGAGTDRVVLFVQGGKGWAEAGADKGETKAKEVTIAAQKEVKEVERAENADVVGGGGIGVGLSSIGAFAAASVGITPPPPIELEKPSSGAIPAGVPQKRHGHNVPPRHEQEEVFGIPKDLLLPASIGALAVVIIGVFTISRLTSSSGY